MPILLNDASLLSDLSVWHSSSQKHRSLNSSWLYTSSSHLQQMKASLCLHQNQRNLLDKCMIQFWVLSNFSPLIFFSDCVFSFAKIEFIYSGTGEKCVLGLATGSTPSQIYRLLVKEHKENGLSFKNVVTFNLDEYYPMDPESLQSYHRFMWESLFKHIDILKENIHIPDGTLPIEDIQRYDAVNYSNQYLSSRFSFISFKVKSALPSWKFKEGYFIPDLKSLNMILPDSITAEFLLSSIIHQN